MNPKRPSRRCLFRRGLWSENTGAVRLHDTWAEKQTLSTSSQLPQAADRGAPPLPKTPSNYLKIFKRLPWANAIPRMQTTTDEVGHECPSAAVSQGHSRIATEVGRFSAWKELAFTWIPCTPHLTRLSHTCLQILSTMNLSDARAPIRRHRNLGARAVTVSPSIDCLRLDADRR